MSKAGKTLAYRITTVEGNVINVYVEDIARDYACKNQMIPKIKGKRTISIAPQVRFPIGNREYRRAKKRAARLVVA